MYVPRAMNSLRMSFCSVPWSWVRDTPCSSPTTTYIASRIVAVALIVMDVETRSSGMSWNSRARSSTVSIATPARPTSPSAIGWSESYPIWVGRSNATESPVWPAASRCRNRAFVCSAVPKPAYWRIVHSLPRYIVGYGPRVYGNAPGAPSSAPSRQSSGPYTDLRSLTSLRLGGEDGCGERDVVPAADHKRGLLVQVLGYDVEDRPAAVRRP